MNGGTNRSSLGNIIGNQTKHHSFSSNQRRSPRISDAFLCAHAKMVSSNLEKYRPKSENILPNPINTPSCVCECHDNLFQIRIHKVVEAFKIETIHLFVTLYTKIFLSVSFNTKGKTKKSLIALTLKSRLYGMPGRIIGSP
jgi:hypothetical protein